MYFPSSPGKLEAESQGSPSHWLLCLGVSCLGSMSQTGKIILWTCWAIWRLREGWMLLTSVIHRPLKAWSLKSQGMQACSSGNCLVALEQASSLNWSHQFHTENSRGQMHVSPSGPSSGCPYLPSEGWLAQSCVNSCWEPWMQRARSTLGSSYMAFPMENGVLPLPWKCTHLLLWYLHDLSMILIHCCPKS